MTDLNTNLNSYTEALNLIINNSGGSIDTLNAINTAIITGEGIDQIIESIAEENPEFAKQLKTNKNTLQKPKVSYDKLLLQQLQISPEIAEQLNINTNATISEFIAAAFNKTITANNKNTSNSNNINTFLGSNNLNSEIIDLMCILLCQSSKSQLVETLKEVLTSKINQRQEASNVYSAKTNDAINANAETQIKQAEAKKVSLFKSIFSAIAAVVSAVVAVAATAATGGASAFLIVGAVAACTCALGTIASSACSIAAIYTENPEKKETLNKLAMGLGIASAIIGLAGSVISGVGLSKLGTLAVSNIVKTAGSIANSISSAAQGVAEIYSGALNIDAAKLQKELANLNIDMAKLDQEIETLVTFIDSLGQDIQKFIENILQCEQEAVNALHDRTETEIHIAQKIA